VRPNEGSYRVVLTAWQHKSRKPTILRELCHPLSAGAKKKELVKLCGEENRENYNLTYGVSLHFNRIHLNWKSF
jgi:hypothetical protein